MLELVLSIINEGLPILDKLVPDQATVIRNRILSLQEKWDAEIAKGEKMDDALVSMYERELLLIGKLFSSSLKIASSKD